MFEVILFCFSQIRVYDVSLGGSFKCLRRFDVNEFQKKINCNQNSAATDVQKGKSPAFTSLLASLPNLVSSSSTCSAKS